MTHFCAQSNPASTAVAGTMVLQDSAKTQCAKARIAQLIDCERELRAALAEVQLEIAMYFGDRDGARRHLKEMEAQTTARRAARETGCFFHDAGARDAEKVQGRTN